MSSTAAQAQGARLVLAADRRKAAPLDPAQPLTIGRASGNRLCLASAEGVSDHHAVVRFSRSNGWLVCDWQSSDGTWLEGQRVRQCRPLSDGDEIRLGRQGPVLVFELINAEGPGASAPADQAAGAQPARAASSASAGDTTNSGPTRKPPTTAGASTSPRTPQPNHQPPKRSLEIDGEPLELAMVRAAAVRSEPLHPHIFSWWLLLCLGGLLLLPFPLLFWPLQVAALAGWILLGARKQHTLVVELHDGRARRHRFANRRTALAHRNGIRKAIGQGDSPA